MYNNIHMYLARDFVNTIAVLSRKKSVCLLARAFVCLFVLQIIIG